MHIPTEQDARHMTEEALGCKAVDARRFATGLCHYVFEVKLADGRAVVARLATPQMASFLAGDIYWRARLGPLGVPLPVQLHSNLSAPIPHVILERLPGDDLGNVYSLLDGTSKRSVVQSVVDAQFRTASLPQARGFGYAVSYEDAKSLPCQNWQQVMVASLDRSRLRIAETSLVDVGIVDQVTALLPRFSAYFARIQPIPFLHDATTKNVIVHQGRLVGIVDLDEMGFGDPLLTVGLTQTSLMAKGFETDYIDHWLSALDASAEQRIAVNFYSAVACVDFVSEQGQLFNKASATPDSEKVAALKMLLAELLARL